MERFTKDLVFLLRASILLAGLLFPATARAYPWMLRNEYAGCNQCHADPSGGGLLTPYGRAQGVILLASKYKKGAEDEDPGTTGDFLFGAIKMPEDGGFLLQTDHRTLALYTKDLKSGSDDSRIILMQSDVASQVRIGERLRANGSVGFVSTGARAAAITRDNALGGQGAAFVSRNHWIGVDLGKDKDYTLRAGRMNLPFGIRSIEHTMWVRSGTRTDINAAQQYGVAVSHTAEKFRFEGMGVVGNFAVSPDDYRERGVVGHFEWFARPNLALGASTLITHAEGSIVTGKRSPTWRQAHGLSARYTPTKMLVLSAEADVLLSSTLGSRREYGFASFVQADLEPWQGLHFMAVAETRAPNFRTLGAGFGGWGGVQWFFFPHFDIRADVVFRNEDVGATGRLNTLAVLGQLHAYL